jgi:hypothetical protein
MNTLLEIELIEKFIRKEKRSRYKQFVSSNKNRKKFIIELSHFKDFRWEMFEEIKTSDRDVILQRLKLINGNKDTCYVISENPAIDQKQLAIEDAISSLGLDMATILIFGQTEMVYYEGEPPNNRYISKV